VACLRHAARVRRGAEERNIDITISDGGTDESDAAFAGGGRAPVQPLSERQTGRKSAARSVVMCNNFAWCTIRV